MKVRVIALGSPHGGDDEVMLGLAGELRDDGDVVSDTAEVVIAGRPGAGLVELLDVDGPVLLLDVVRSGAAPGTIHQLPLARLLDRGVALEPVSSHGFGPAEALRLAAALGRRIPIGEFLGVEGERFTIGAAPSEAVAAALPRLRERITATIAALAEQHTREQGCTSPG